MWYVIQVFTGNERVIQHQCENLIRMPVLERCFLPAYEEKRKIRGEWQIMQRILFPGYLFLVTEAPEELYEALRRVIGLTKMLRVGESMIPLTEEEVNFLQDFSGEKQVVELSTGIVEGDEVRVHSGPLQGKEGLIKRIDRHKRVAWLELPMFGGMQRVRVGLEIVEKK